MSKAEERGGAEVSQLQASTLVTNFYQAESWLGPAVSGEEEGVGRKTLRVRETRSESKQLCGGTLSHQDH